MAWDHPAWNPKSEPHTGCTVLAKGEHVFGPLPRLCKLCENWEPYRRPWTHIVMAPRGDVRHLARMVKGLETGIAKTFCERRFIYKGAG